MHHALRDRSIADATAPPLVFSKLPLPIDSRRIAPPSCHPPPDLPMTRSFSDSITRSALTCHLPLLCNHLSPIPHHPTCLLHRPTFSSPFSLSMSIYISISKREQLVKENPAGPHGNLESRRGRIFEIRKRGRGLKPTFLSGNTSSVKASAQVDYLQPPFAILNLSISRSLQPNHSNRCPCSEDGLKRRPLETRAPLCRVAVCFAAAHAR